MRGTARFDCRKRNMREKERVIQGGGGGEEEEGAHLCWPKLDNDLCDWRDAPVAGSAQRTSGGWDAAKHRHGRQVPPPRRKEPKLYVCHQHYRRKQTEAYLVED